MASILFVTNDAKTFRVDLQVAQKWEAFRCMIDTFTSAGVSDDEECPIPLPGVDSGTLEWVLKWCDHHKDHIDENDDKDEGDNKEKKMNANSTVQACDQGQWDEDFFGTTNDDTLSSLTLAANYLQIDPLLQRCCQYIASKVKKDCHDMAERGKKEKEQIE